MTEGCLVNSHIVPVYMLRRFVVLGQLYSYGYQSTRTCMFYFSAHNSSCAFNSVCYLYLQGMSSLHSLIPFRLVSLSA